MSVQLQDELRAAIREGRLAAGARLSSTRTFAADLGVSRSVVVDAYSQLIAEGYLTARPGSPTRVNSRAAAPRARPLARESADPKLSFDFRMGLPDLSLFPRLEWGRALRRALARAADSELGYPDPRGALRLRRELATYLGRVRGVQADPERIVICNGFAQGLGLVCQVLVSTGRSIAVEDPGSPPAWRAMAPTGIDQIPVPVDKDGIRVEALEASRASSVLITPAHQYPTGVALAPERRTELLDWARDDRLVIEDDYDAEFRYDRQPVGALQGLSPEDVVYAGSTSKTLAPSLRLGWLVLPTRLLDDVVAAKRAADLGSPALEQLALADLLERGSYDRQLRKVRRAYSAKRATLVSSLTHHAAELAVTGIAAGLHTVLELPSGISEPRMVAAARERSVGVSSLGRFRLASSAPPAAITLGYGSLAAGAIPAGVQRLAAALGDLS